MSKRTHSFGYTILELVVVIVVLGALSSLLYHAYNSRKDKARAALMWSDLQALKSALNDYAKFEGISTWWTQTDFGATGPTDETTFEEIIADPGDNNSFARYMARAPEPPIDLLTAYGYDQDSDTIANDSFDSRTCPEPSGHAGYKGVNIVADVLATDTYGANFFNLMDETYDDGNPNCGYITVVTIGSPSVTRLYYHVAIDENDLPSSL